LKYRKLSGKKKAVKFHADLNAESNTKYPSYIFASKGIFGNKTAIDDISLLINLCMHSDQMIVLNDSLRMISSHATGVSLFTVLSKVGNIKVSNY